MEDTRKMVDDIRRNDTWSGSHLTVNLSKAFPTSATCFYVLPRLNGPGRVELWQKFCQKSQIGSGVSCLGVFSRQFLEEIASKSRRKRREVNGKSL